MTMPYYVAPEQVMKDRAEYAQKGIARGRALVGTTYGAGVLIVAENPSEVTLSLAMETPGLLILTDSWDKGWRARLNVKPVPGLAYVWLPTTLNLPRGKRR